MSRRIIFAALAASAALIATQAIADRECFEDSCRVPEAAEPSAAAAAAKSEEPETEPQAAQAQAQAQAQAEPQPSAPQAAAQASAVPEPVPPGVTVTVIPEPAKSVVPPAAEASANSRLAPGSVLPKVVAEPAPPKVVAEPAPRQMPPQASTRAEEARMRREPARVAPGTAETRKPVVAPAPVAVPAAAPPVRAVNVAVPAYVRPERPPQPAYVPPAAPRPPADYVVRERPSVATAAVVEVPGEIQTGDGLVTVYPNLRPDPAWKLCQIDSRDLGRRSYRCTAYSYHPYGEGGYRPYGTYRNHPAAPGYVVAPNAKIISIDTND